MREEGRLLVGPQRCAKIFGALARPRPDDDPVALSEGPLEELGLGAPFSAIGRTIGPGRWDCSYRLTAPRRVRAPP